MSPEFPDRLWVRLSLYMAAVAIGHDAEKYSLKGDGTVPIHAPLIRHLLEVIEAYEGEAPPRVRTYD